MARFDAQFLPGLPVPREKRRIAEALDMGMFVVNGALNESLVEDARVVPAFRLMANYSSTSPYARPSGSDSGDLGRYQTSCREHPAGHSDGDRGDAEPFLLFFQDDDPRGDHQHETLRVPADADVAEQTIDQRGLG